MPEINYPIIRAEETEQRVSYEDEDLYFADRAMARDIYLLQKPACFMVVGNPSTGKTTLAKKLVQEMRSTELIEQNMRDNTLLGKYCAKQLLSGRTIANKTLVALLKDAISLPECQHYGYVMDSFPTYLAFEEQIELVENLPLKPDFVINIEIPDEDLRKRLESQRVDPINGAIYNYYNLEDPPGPLIKSAQSAASRPKPKTVVREKEEEQGLEMDDVLMEEGIIGEVNTEKGAKSWHPEFPRPTKEVAERLLLRPEDSQRELDKLFKLSRDTAQKSLEQFLRKFPRTHVIRIDGNCPPTQMFYNLMVKVKAMSIRPAIPPYHLLLKTEEEEEEEAEEPEREGEEKSVAEPASRALEEPGGDKALNEAEVDVDLEIKERETDWDEVISSLAVHKMPTEHSRWQLSEWQRFCPVQLYNGILEYGKSQFACGFLGYLYFLSCRTALRSFIRNPRPYLDFQIPQPKLTVRIAVVGFHKSGSATLCHLLADRHGAVCISLTELLRKDLDAQLEATLAKVKAEVEANMVEKLNNQRKREIEEIKTNNYADNASMKLAAETVSAVADEILENIVESKAGEGEKYGLKEVITEEHPQVVEAVTRVLRFTKAQPNYLEPKRYVDTLVAELARLDRENRNILPSKRKPLSWVIEGLPPLEEVWQELKKRSRSVAKAVKYVRQACENVYKLERAMHRRELSKAAMEEGEEEEGEGSGKEEAMMEGEAVGGTEETVIKLPKSDESANPYAKKLDPRLVKAREVADEATARVIPLDPMPLYVFKMKDDLPDYALMIHRLYGVGFGPLEDLPALSKAEGIDESAIEPMVATGTSEKEPSKEKSDALHDEDDAVTEPPEDPPTSGQIYHPMPQPGPEVDCVRDQLVQFDRSWEASKQGLSTSTTAYGFPVHVQDLSIRKDKTFDNLLAEVNNEFGKLFKFTAKESSQEMLDEEAEAETEGFAETGGLEDNPALAATEGEEMEEGEEGEEEEGEEKEEVEGAIDENEEEVEEEMEAEEDASRSANRKLGQTSYFCPVAYRDYRVVKPGDPELVATYKGLAYYLGSEKDMAKFMANPEKYVTYGHQPPLKPPPLRIALLGPPGTGKTLHGRQIAGQLDLIHVSFDQMLQDVMMRKLKHRIGPEYEDDKEVPVKVMPNLEEAVAKALRQLENPKAAEEEAATAPPASTKVTDEGDAPSPDANLTPHELAIREFLENDEALPEASLNLLLPRLWHEEPYRSKGFILEGFPRSADDVTYLLEANLFVDFALVLNAEAENLLPRLLPVRLAKWKVRMAKIEANRKIVTDWKAQKRKRIREERRKTIIKSLSEKRITRFMRQTLDDVVTEMEDMEVDEDRDLDDEVNISEMLDEEIPEEEEEEAEDEETEGEATTRIEEEISDRVESVNANTEEVMEALTEAKIPHFSIRADDQLTRVRYRIVKKIKNLILNREALFERVYPITLEEGENLIASGFKHFSPFTRFCPISWDRVSIARLPPLNPSPLLRYSRLDRRLVEPQLGDSIAPDTPIGKGKKGSASGVQTCCAVYRECVYWFASEVERKVFMTNPIAAIRRAGEQTRTLVHQPLEVAVTGGPTSQREFISKRLGTDLHVVHVTTTAAVQWLLSSVSQSWTSLAQQIREVIMSGAALCDDLVAKALRVALLAPQIQARGYVLDNYPITVDQAKFMHASSIRPFLMLELHSKHCNHPSIEVSWFDNWNNQEPPDCPFLKVWLNMKARRGRSLGAGLGGLADGIDGFGGAGRGRGAGGAGLGGEGFGEDGRGRRGGRGSDEDDGFGGGGRGGGGGGGRRGGGGGGVGSSRDGAGGRGGPGSGLSGSESEGQGGRRKGGADGSSGSRDGLGGRGGRGGRYGSGGSEDGSDRDGFGRGGKGRGGRRGGLGRDGEWDESDGEGGFGRRRGRGAKYGDDDEYSDGEGGRGGRGRGRRRGRGSGGSSDESDGEGRHGRGRHGRRGRHRRRRGSDDSYDEDDSRGGGRRRRRHRGRRDGSDDSDGSGRRGRRRRGRHGSGGSSEDEDDDYSRYGKGGKGGRDGSSGESDEEAEWKKRRHRRIDEPLEKRYGIPSAETDRMPDEILKHFAYVDAESARRSWLKSHSGTLTDISAEDSALVALKKALLTTTHRMAHVMEYEANRRRSRPMSVSEMGLTMKQFDKNIGEFGHYCPVRLAENDELFDCREEHTAPLVTRLPGAESCLPNARYNSAFGSTSLRYIVDILDVDLHPHIPTDLRFAVEFNGKMYRTAGPEELRKFMANPEKYLPPQVPKGLPEENDLPKKLPAGTIPRDSFPRQIALRGFCPVCFHESGQHYEGLREGDANILALYKGQIYAFCSEECRNKFMHHPWLYADLKLPNKLPPMKVPISVDELPLPGYLEQTVAYVLRNALAMCSKFRPKYPFITPERSALIYMALQLKALNPRTPEYLRFRAKSRVERFERACQLIDQLTAIMPVDYQAECQRSETLSRQLHEFLSLQNQVDNEDRWIYSI